MSSFVMPKRKVGNSDLEVSEICLGLMGMSEFYSTGKGRDKDEEYLYEFSFYLRKRHIKTIKAALDLGINYFDTSDIYGLGHNEELLGM